MSSDVHPVTCPANKWVIIVTAVPRERTRDAGRDGHHKLLPIILVVLNLGASVSNSQPLIHPATIPEEEKIPDRLLIFLSVAVTNSRENYCAGHGNNINKLTPTTREAIHRDKRKKENGGT